jgi:hypothetical protein
MIPDFYKDNPGGEAVKTIEAHRLARLAGSKFPKAFLQKVFLGFQPVKGHLKGDMGRGLQGVGSPEKGLDFPFKAIYCFPKWGFRHKGNEIVLFFRNGFHGILLMDGNTSCFFKQ